MYGMMVFHIDCRKSLNEMADQFHIHQIWMSGHGNISGNCSAYEISRVETTLQVQVSLEPWTIWKILKLYIVTPDYDIYDPTNLYIS